MNLYELRRIFESGNGMTKWRALLGLSNENGRDYINYESGDRVIENQHIKPNMVPTDMLAEAIFGANGNNGWREQLRSGNYTRVAEAGAVQPSAFLNINAFGDATGGMLEARMLEAYNSPDFITDRLVDTVQSKLVSEKIPGITNVGDEAMIRNPSEPHASVQVGERWVKTPDTVEYGLKMDVTKEAFFFDLTGQLMKQADSIGESVKLRREKRTLDVILGITNSYNYNGTSYSTYLTSGNWINKKTGNELVDWTDVDAAEALFAEMTDQETGERINIGSERNLLVMPGKAMAAKKMFTDTYTEKRSNSAADVSGGSNPLAGILSAGVPLSSAIAHQQLVADSIASATATKYWYYGNFRKAFAYYQNFPFTSSSVTADEYKMKDEGLVLSVICDERGTPVVLDPRYVIQCTG